MNFFDSSTLSIPSAVLATPGFKSAIARNTKSSTYRCNALTTSCFNIDSGFAIKSASFGMLFIN